MRVIKKKNHVALIGYASQALNACSALWLAYRGKKNPLDWAIFLSTAAASVVAAVDIMQQDQKRDYLAPTRALDANGDKIWFPLSVNTTRHSLLLREIDKVVVDPMSATDSMEVYLGKTEIEGIPFLVYYADEYVIYFQKQDEPRVNDLCARAFKKHFPWNNIAISDVALPVQDHTFTSGETLQDTEVTDAITSRIQAFVEGGVPRSVLLCGPPGSGKTSAAILISRKLGMRSVRITGKLVADSFTEAERVVPKDGKSWEAEMALLTFMSLVKPDAVIIDDFDRVSSTNAVSASALYVLEQLRKHCKVIILTANRPQVISGALRRPGRVDELFRIDYVAPKLLEKLLHGHTELVDAAREAKLPVAFVEELGNVLKILGEEAAFARLETLKAAHKEISADNDSADWQADQVTPSSCMVTPEEETAFEDDGFEDDDDIY